MQAEIAKLEAEVILMNTNRKEGETDEDMHVARIVQKSEMPSILLVNKIDNFEMRDEIYDFYRLGLGEPFPVAGSHGLGLGDSLDAAVEHFKNIEVDLQEDDSVKVSLI